MHTMRKTKTQVTRICPSTLQYILLSPGFTCVHTERQLHSHHFSHCCKYIQIPWPLLPPLYIPGKTPTVGSCMSLGTNQLTALPSVTNLFVPQCCTFRLYLPDSSCAFPFLHTLPPSCPHSLSAHTPHMSLWNQKPLCDLSYLLTTQSEPGVHLHAPSLVSTEKVYLPSSWPWIPSLWLINVLVLFASPSVCISNFFPSAGSFSWAWKHAPPSPSFKKSVLGPSSFSSPGSRPHLFLLPYCTFNPFKSAPALTTAVSLVVKATVTLQLLHSTPMSQTWSSFTSWEQDTGLLYTLEHIIYLASGKPHNPACPPDSLVLIFSFLTPFADSFSS